MGTIALTITATGAGITDGEKIVVGLWSAGIDHAALVTALRSRADGYDLRLRNTSTGALVPFTFTGAGTANLRLAWTFAGFGDLGAPDTNTSYQVEFGDLGWQIDPQGTPTGADATNATITAGSPSALSMPAPSLGARIEYLRAADEAPGLSPRRAIRHRVQRSRCSVEFSNLSPSDYYDLRAWCDARRGRIPASEIPDATVSASAPYFVIESKSFEQSTKRDYSARLVLLGVPL